MHMEGRIAIQAASATRGWELAGLTVRLPEVELSDLTVAVLEGEDSREGEGAEDSQEEAVGVFLVEGAMGIDEMILMM